MDLYRLDPRGGTTQALWRMRAQPTAVRCDQCSSSLHFSDTLRCAVPGADLESSRHREHLMLICSNPPVLPVAVACVELLHDCLLQMTGVSLVALQSNEGLPHLRKPSSAPKVMIAS